MRLDAAPAVISVLSSNLMCEGGIIPVALGSHRLDLDTGAGPDDGPDYELANLLTLNLGVVAFTLH